MKRMRRTVALAVLMGTVFGALMAFGCGKEAGVNTDNTPPAKTAQDEGKKQAGAQEQMHNQKKSQGQPGQ